LLHARRHRGSFLAAGCIGKYHPIVFVEKLKSDATQLRAWLEALDYSVIDAGGNFPAIHKADKCLAQVKVVPATAA